MTDVQKELQKLKTLINQRPATAIFSNKSNESDKIAHGDAEFFINDMSKKFVFTRSRVKNPVMIDAETKSLENVDYINGTKVEDFTGSIQEINKLKDITTDHEERISEVEGTKSEYDERIGDVENELEELEHHDHNDKYALIEHSHNTINNALTVNGHLNLPGNGFLNIGNIQLRQTADTYAIFKLQNIDWWSCNNSNNSMIVYKNLDVKGKTTIRGDLQVEGTITGDLKNHTHDELVGSDANYTLTLANSVLRYWNEALEKDQYMYFQIGRGHDIEGGAFWFWYTQPGKMVFKFYPGNTFMTFDNATHTTKMQGKIELTNDLYMIREQTADVGPNIFMGDVEIRTALDTCNFYVNDSMILNIKKAGLTVRNGDLTVNNNMSLNGNATVKGTIDFTESVFNNPSLKSGETIVKLDPNKANYKATVEITSPKRETELVLNPYNNSSCPFRINANSDNKSVMMSAVNGEKVELRCDNKIATLLDKSGDITIPRRINCGSDETTFYNPTIVAKYAMRLECPNIDSTAMLFIHTSNNQLMVQNKKGVNVGLVDLANGKRVSNETITHTTNIVGNFEIGTFCEANGNIYDGYEKINNTDCICAVKQATLLNKKIVGIISSEDEFASHGDVLVKIAPETICEVGDILCPDERGYGRVASEDELIFMMMYAIPRPKITCLETGIEGFVACFIV